MKRNLFYLGLVFMTSCTPIAKSLYGITDPKIETQESLKKYMNSINLNSNNILYVKNFDLYKTALLEFNKKVPDAVLFDSDGNRITYKKEIESCNAGLFATIPEFNRESKLKSENGKNLIECKDIFIDSNNNKLEKLPKADFYLFINWAKFTGRLNKDHVKIWEELAENNKNVNILIYKVNMDIQEGWNIPKEKMKVVDN